LLQKGSLPFARGKVKLLAVKNEIFFSEFSWGDHAKNSGLSIDCPWLFNYGFKEDCLVDENRFRMELMFKYDRPPDTPLVIMVLRISWRNI
jgi:hypothetical protein